jgi:outer membrane PBP1 activator LpoA protein
MAFHQARDDGAMQIVGPLRVESTRALGGLQDLTTPLLLLNEPPSGIPTGEGRSTVVNSLMLSQTEEAEAIARKAIKQGQKRAIVIIPDDSWGQRMADAFSNTFEQYGGQIIASSRYGIAGIDHSTTLTQLLMIDESERRKTDLQSWLGVPLNFEPSRREDFDIIFMAARPEAGRELKPLLRFHDAGDIPVYAMSRIYSGRVAPASDRDLDGVIFPTTRWQLRASGKTYKLPASVRDGAFGNFYALGQDTWRLLPWLPLMRKDPDLWFSGEVGALRLIQDGRIQREPAWAQFSAGLPAPYQWPDSL